jgi:hypothetical protein
MSRGPQAFRQRDLIRAVRAVAKAGLPVAKVEVDKDGKIIVVMNEPGKTVTADRNDWDTP